MRKKQHHDFVIRRPSRQKQRKVKRYARLAAASVCILVALFCLIRLVHYAFDFISSFRTSQALKEDYYAEEYLDIAETGPQDEYPSEPTPLPETTAIPYVDSTPTPSLTAMPSPDLSLYPDNPRLSIQPRFGKIRKQNKDIVAWLKMDQILDQAVVQRDNTYYLRRDYRGYHNENGALFLDENCNLEKRPAICIVWGHNMKTGAMFGCLRQFEDTHFYHNNPFISFDTIYEDGEYVIFAVSDLSLTHLMEAILLQNSFLETSRLIQKIISASVYTCPLDVTAEDQLLILVTCTGDENVRRAVVARRIRKDETEEVLRSIVSKSRKR